MSLPLPGLALVSPAELAHELGIAAPTPEQAAVIAAPPEPALVVAGAGAGKTETMAGRVVWLVANGLVTPDRVLGLTFTRKAARQLADRVRARLRRLAGARLLDKLDPTGERRAAVYAGEPTVLTYHAYAGRLVAEHGLRLPVEPGARLLTETASWQAAHRVVSTWSQDLDTDLVPATITQRVLQLAGELAEHLVDEDALRRSADELCVLIESAPRAKGQRQDLSQKLREVIVTQRFRVALLALVDAYTERKRREGAIDFGDQMSLAARLAETHPEVVAGERSRYTAVLLDEYQDTGHSQRVLLRALFGLSQSYPDAEPMTVTAVGDPAQAIYGWRGASAANLPRFATDFPRRDGGRLVPAAKYGLLTSFRNPAEVLDLANAISAPLRANGLEVDELRSRQGAPAGDVTLALLSDVDTEVQWVANQVADRWHAALQADGKAPTAAVLVRRRADMADLATALRERGLPVEVVGLGGLLDEPEVRDLVSALRVLIDPLAGTAAARLLTGSRWRLGAADLAALWARARELSGTYATPQEGPFDALPGEGVEQAGLVDAIDDPGEREAYSDLGYRRIRALGAELRALRRRLDQPLPELVADVERTMQLDIEATARRGGVGRAHLDAFADVVADYARAAPSASLAALLDYLRTAEDAEDGLEPGEVEVADDRVQILTVHSAKGLEWRIVAVPHLVDSVFPTKRRGGSWLTSVTELPAHLRGDAQDLPVLNLGPAGNRKEVEALLEEHKDAFAERALLEERRLCYVALTRAEHSLIVSGHWWGKTKSTPSGPSEFLTELAGFAEAAGWTDVVEIWESPPPDGAENPLSAKVNTAQWPADPLGERRADVVAGAELVRAELAALGDTPDDPPDDPDGWVRDTDVLLAERAAAAARRERVALPEQLSVSQLVELAADRDALARRLRRPLPYPPNPVARRGTAFHTWLERRFGSRALIDLDELPGAADDDAAPDDDLDALQAAFLRSSWADRVPHDVEVPFATEIDGFAIRGRMDAVFRDEDGGWTVVDWKTGAVPDAERLPALTVQLAAYRLAWAGLTGVHPDQVRAAFHYVRHDRTLRPADLLDADGLRDLLRSVPLD
ncbi:ATP-dependent DNA helicase [Actinokineospora sp. UTMC 2448]|uniref:ATP-dependent helicase n=1 Tax=Actinokineospora sp. UTMC 2448 TaxID=2268449 RepID=UPI0021643F92|nr:ATP-dependent DNA helicase [Actinokineospora sp. UTMC 2448]UVS77208.1 ATP-dependent DNA helicase PcrA [Actinokineospora sp. UTMC 2448]